MQLHFGSIPIVLPAIGAERSAFHPTFRLANDARSLAIALARDVQSFPY
jgi:hypothetical protein